MDIKVADIVLCEFYFSDLKSSKKRPVLVFKNNLPYNDFVAIPISSKTDNLRSGEVLLDNDSFEHGSIPKTSKLIIRKTFVVSKEVVLKKYGMLKNKSFQNYHLEFCTYFNCERNVDLAK